MSYVILFQPKALAEYEEAVTWYRNNSIEAAENFKVAVEERLTALKSEPDRYRNTYKEFYEIALNKYPYILIYLIDETKKNVIISSVFHTKRNPDNKFSPA
jgi:plasmid stabilization system protein ParE